MALGSKGYELQWLSCAGTAEFVRERWSCSIRDSPVHPSCIPDLCWTSAAQPVRGDQSILLGCNPWLLVTHSDQALCNSSPAPFSLLLPIFVWKIHIQGWKLCPANRCQQPHVLHTCKHGKTTHLPPRKPPLSTKSNHSVLISHQKAFSSCPPQLVVAAKSQPACS